MNSKQELISELSKLMNWSQSDVLKLAIEKKETFGFKTVFEALEYMYEEETKTGEA
jgi:hypothetical protein